MAKTASPGTMDSYRTVTVATIVDYVSDGGGLLLGGLGWSWILYNPDELPIEAYPANRLATSFGFSFTNDSFEVGVDLRLQPPKN